MAKLSDLLPKGTKDQIEKRYGSTTEQANKSRASRRTSIREHSALPSIQPSVTKKRAISPPPKLVEEKKVYLGLEIAKKHPGVFSNREIEVLNKHFSYCEKLIIKEFPPRDQTDRHLIKVCRGEVPADTVLETVFIKYLKAIGKYPIIVVFAEDDMGEIERRRELGQSAYDLNRRQANRESAGQKTGIPEVEEGYPKDEFGSREDHKKLRSRDWGDMKRRSRG
jgi:uncharacterized protein YifE (UPF0438 family)